MIQDEITDAALIARMHRAPPMNMAYVREVMARHDLAGVVLSEPLAIFHATGAWPQLSRLQSGQPPVTFVLLARDDSRPTGYVASRFAYYYTFADHGLGERVQPFLFDQLGDAGPDADGADPDCADSLPPRFRDHGAEPQDAVETDRGRALRAALDQNGCAHDAGAALVKAMRALGLWRGRIAYDHPVIAGVCERHDHPGTLVAGDNIVREMRLVKSPFEIEMMRRASKANVAAVLATAAAMRAGADYRDIAALFMREATARGNVPLMLNVDRVSSPFHEGRMRDGQAFFIDAVSHFQNYHGDYGRTIFIGEPAGEVRRAAEAAQFGWNAVREMLRPGVRYSEIIAAGKAALVKGGYDFGIAFTPHSVGLRHTDEPYRVEQGFYVKDDLVLQAGMIISVDCPILATGIGGSVHLEDLVLIEEDGATPIHDVGPGVICV